MFVYYDDLKAGCGEANVIVSTSNKSIVHHGEILEISQLSVKFLIFPFMKFLGVKYQNKPTALSSIISPVTYVTYNVCISTDPQLSPVKILKIGHYERGVSPTILIIHVERETDSTHRPCYMTLCTYVLLSHLCWLVGCHSHRTIMLS